MELEELNTKIAYDELEDACIALREAKEKVEASFGELREAIDGNSGKRAG